MSKMDWDKAAHKSAVAKSKAERPVALPLATKYNRDNHVRNVAKKLYDRLVFEAGPTADKPAIWKKALDWAERKIPDNKKAP